MKEKLLLLSTLALCACGPDDRAAQGDADDDVGIDVAQIVYHGGVPTDVFASPLAAPEDQLATFDVPAAALPDDAQVVDEETSSASVAVEDVADSAEQSLVNGAEQHGYNGVGKLYIRTTNDRYFFCTATLVAPHVVVTAAHCVAYQSRSATANYGYFVPQHFGYNGSTPSMIDYPAFVVTKFRSFYSPDHPISTDLALVHLHRDVPASWAARFRLDGDRVLGPRTETVIGYGCTRRGTDRGTGVKRSFSYVGPRSTTGRLCSGDSGGPTLPSGMGVTNVSSAYNKLTGVDYYAAVRSRITPMKSQLDAWR